MTYVEWEAAIDRNVTDTRFVSYAVEGRICSDRPKRTPVYAIWDGRLSHRFEATTPRGVLTAWLEGMRVTRETMLDDDLPEPERVAS